ncbi:MAG: hypothetical protein NUW37_14495 [Planctomycetes bacterium]|nr:hypothetical protein [Planctomycetota bacterium]
MKIRALAFVFAILGVTSFVIAQQPESESVPRRDKDANGEGWKFESGEVFDYEIATEEVRTGFTSGEGDKELEKKIQLWGFEVTYVNPDGTAYVEGTLKRVRTEEVDVDGSKTTFDSSDLPEDWHDDIEAAFERASHRYASDGSEILPGASPEEVPAESPRGRGPGGGMGMMPGMGGGEGMGSRAVGFDLVYLGNTYFLQINPRGEVLYVNGVDELANRVQQLANSERGQGQRQGQGRRSPRNRPQTENAAPTEGDAEAVPESAQPNATPAEPAQEATSEAGTEESAQSEAPRQRGPRGQNSGGQSQQGNPMMGMMADQFMSFGIRANLSDAAKLQNDRRVFDIFPAELAEGEETWQKSFAERVMVFSACYHYDTYKVAGEADGIRTIEFTRETSSQRREGAPQMASNLLIGMMLPTAEFTDSSGAGTIRFDTRRGLMIETVRDYVMSFNYKIPSLPDWPIKIVKHETIRLVSALAEDADNSAAPEENSGDDF